MVFHNKQELKQGTKHQEEIKLAKFIIKIPKEDIFNSNEANIHGAYTLFHNSKLLQ